MTWQEIARTDIEAGVRSRSLWAVVVVFLVAMLVLGRFVARGSLLSALFDTNARTFALFLTLLFVPVVGLLVGHRALVRAHERTTADGDDESPETVDGEPRDEDDENTEQGDSGPSGRDLFVGTVVGRGVVLTVAVLAGFLPVFVAWVVQSGTAALYEILVAFLVAVVLGLLFVGLGVAISTVTASSARAAAGAAGAFVGLYTWPFLPSLVGVDVPFALLERFWLVFLVGDLSTTLFSLRQGEVPAAILGALLLSALVVAPLALGYVRFRRDGLPV
jgi:ABC-2 type transport system permease protein